MKTLKEVENQNVKTNINKRIKMLAADIQKNENLFEESNMEKYKRIANNLRARRGELQLVSKMWF